MAKIDVKGSAFVGRNAFVAAGVSAFASTRGWQRGKILIYDIFLPPCSSLFNYAYLLGLAESLMRSHAHAFPPTRSHILRRLFPFPTPFRGRTMLRPGPMWTRQNELHAASGSPYFAKDPDVVAANKVGSVPMKRLGTTEEVLKSVAFLLSDDSSYTTAFNLVVDGGMSGGLR